MTIREIVESQQGGLVTLPRLDWLAVLKKAVSADPVEQRMITDLRQGSEPLSTDVVVCERSQVLIVCGLADRPAKQQKSEATP